MEELNMTKTCIAVATLVLALTVPTTVSAHEGHAHKFMGTLSSVQETQFEVKTTDGKMLVSQVNPKTVYQRGKAKVAGTELKVGERVVVSALQVPAGKTMTAQVVQLAVAPAAASK
jgi:hypothetical protein